LRDAPMIVRGRDSISEGFGGGEVDVTHWFYGAGLSLGRRVGSPGSRP
jgi:hypothetical protein